MGHCKIISDVIKIPTSLIDENGLKLVDTCKKLGIESSSSATIASCCSDDVNLNTKKTLNLVTQRKACATIENEWGKSTSTECLLHKFDGLKVDGHDLHCVVLVRD